MENVEDAAHEGGCIQFLVFENDFAIELKLTYGLEEFLSKVGGGGFGF